MSERVCPWWIGYLLASPIRRLVQKPESILGSYIKKGDTVLDVGSAMGFFSIPMAKMVGTSGQVVCLDVQQRMLDTLQKRAHSAGVGDIIKTQLCPNNTLEITHLNSQVAFALAFAVIHEVADIPGVFSQLYSVLVPGGQLLFVEPRGHVSQEKFQREIGQAQDAGFLVRGQPTITRSLSALLQKPKS